MERWVGTCRRELLDRMLIWNQPHLLHALREYETHYNLHRPHRALNQNAPLQPAPEPITSRADIVDLNVRRRDQLGGILHEYKHAASAWMDNRRPQGRRDLSADDEKGLTQDVGSGLDHVLQSAL